MVLRKSLLIIIIFFLGNNCVFSLSLKKHEKLGLLTIESPNFYYQEIDTTIAKEYSEVKKLYDDNELTKSLEKALYVLGKINKIEGEGDVKYRVNFLIGNIFRRNNNHLKSISYYKKALKILLEEKTLLLDSKGLVNSKNDNYNSALINNYLKLGNEYLRNNNIDSAKYFYNETLSIQTLNDRPLSYQASASSNLSGIYMRESLFDKAKEFALKASKIHLKRNNKVSEASALGNLASVYLMEDNYKKAKETYFKALEIIKNEKTDRALKTREKLYFNLAYNLYKLKDYTAYDFQEKSYMIKDSLRDREIRQMIEELDAKYNFDVAKEIGRKEEEIKRQKAQRNTWILGITSFFIIVLLVFLLNQYKLRQKNLGLELSKQELQQQQKLEKIKSESQVRILNATLDGKETERKQIAETLHDSVSALLSSANLHLQACKKQFNGSTPVEVDKSQSIINEASQKIRDLSHTLVSSILLKFGLSYAIKDLTEKFSNSQLTIESETKYIKRYDQGFEIKLYNIIQEFINNILKHSEANYAKIMLIEKNKKLILTIEDNGKGFDKTLIPEKDGLGINQIDARIQMMQGKFLIESGKGKGTVINIELPIFEKKLAAIS